jgi:phospholipid/cholesterol/gamma-HCH transport system permease protein
VSEQENHPSVRDEGLSPVWRPLAGLGKIVMMNSRLIFGWVGAMSCLLGAATAGTIRGAILPGEQIRREALIFQMVRVGVKAIPIVILIELAIGVILPLQMFPKLDEFGQADQIATINAIAAFRELGPLMTAVILSGFAGASIAAELGTMVTAEETEALESMALNPIRFLVIPRMLATIIMMVMLTVIADIVMIFGGWLTAMNLGIDSDVFYQLTTQAVNVTGFVTGLIKAGVFGLLIGLIACYLGLSVQPWRGSEGVGLATTNTVVYSIVAIIGADAIFTVIFYSYGLFK